MKAIVSHDIDHLTLSEHYLKDLIVPKYFVRSYIELFSGKISVTELFHRYADVFRNQWQHIESLHDFNTTHGVQATFFIGVNNGVGLNYSQSQSAFWIQKMLEMGCEVGVHGIEFENFDKIKTEYSRFKELSNQQSFGTRMHYIRTNEHTFENMAKAGYIFDSSEMGFKSPYKIGDMWEFPFQIMDGYIIEKPKQWQSKNFQQSCDETKEIIDNAADLNLPYLGIDFHDRYFSDAHKTWKDWYIWLIDYLLNQGIEFVSFKKAIKELES
ncbi:MAG: hypothetical protein K0S53_2536 [Bacteroidetes bacterium]|jgi:hypothetical protein|nr:hypothetical protein [Bacteroidota bacterium]MDF2452460.1 hypothetical protein [Bacteroidota bacterium]